VTPGLTVVIVGEDPASQVYVRMKGKACEQLGMHSETIRLPAQAAETELLDVIERLNHDPAIHGMLVQLPLPRHIDENRVLLRILPGKDVDGFHPENVGKVAIGDPTIPRSFHGEEPFLEFPVQWRSGAYVERGSAP